MPLLEHREFWVGLPSSHHLLQFLCYEFLLGRWLLLAVQGFQLFQYRLHEQRISIVMGFQCYGFLQSCPGERIIINQGICAYKGENIQENLERWITWLVLESDGLGEGCAIVLMTRLVKIFLFLVGTRGAAPPENCLRLKADCSTFG